MARPRRTRPGRNDRLTFQQRLYWQLGPMYPDPADPTPAERAEWRRVRDQVMANHPAGSRPWGYWKHEAPADLRDRPDTYTNPSRERDDALDSSRLRWLQATGQLADWEAADILAAAAIRPAAPHAARQAAALRGVASAPRTPQDARSTRPGSAAAASPSAPRPRRRGRPARKEA